MIIPTAWILLLAQAPIPLGPSAPGAIQGGEAAAPQMPASAPAPIPLTPEQQAERISSRLTSLATRIQSLRRMSGTDQVQPPALEVPKSELPALRTATSDLAIELQRRSMVVEVPYAGRATIGLLAKRVFPSDTFAAPPELKITPEAAKAAAAIPEVTGPQLPSFDPERANDVIFKIGTEPIFRGEIERMVTARKKLQPTAKDDTLTQFVLNQALIPRAAVLIKTRPQLQALGQKAKELTDQILSGRATFEEIASKHSEDPSTKKFGGRFEANPLMLSDFERATLMDMKPGDISKPFATTSGLEVLKLEARTDDPGSPAQKVTIRRILLAYQFGVPFDQSQSKITDLIREAKVEVVDVAYEPFLPPQVPRAEKTSSAPK